MTTSLQEDLFLAGLYMTGFGEMQCLKWWLSNEGRWVSVLLEGGSYGVLGIQMVICKRDSVDLGEAWGKSTQPSGHEVFRLK